MRITDLIQVVATCFLLVSCSDSPEFTSVKDGHFTGVSSPCYIGTNFWYGAILASEGKGGDRQRLDQELDKLQDMGVANLRILVGGDGPDGVMTRIEPTLQKAPGQYNEQIFIGLDYLLCELSKRSMQAVLYVNNSWEWSGGYGMYLEWAGEGEALIPAEVGYQTYMEWAGTFVTNRKAKELFAQHLTNVVSRTNSITGIPYKDDPTIFAWQIGNEPRCFSSDPSTQNAFVEWLWDSAALIKSIDPNHMVSTGSEGSWGCEGSIELFERIHSCPDIDYLTIHIWPYNWSWADPNDLQGTLSTAIANTDKYIDEHLEVAEKLAKPVVIEEFGFPRDEMSCEIGSSTSGRDAYYAHVFDRVIQSSKQNGMLAGCNFWGWGGFARPGQYCGDPAQEPFGLNSVFADDSTVEIIKNSNEKIKY